MALRNPLHYDTIAALFSAAAKAYPARPFINTLSETAKAYQIAAGEIRYSALHAAVRDKQAAYAKAGYGPGHRVGILLENRPDVFVHWLALNALGASMVPINPELRAAELEYLISHSEMVLAIALPARQEELRQAAAHGFTVIGSDDPIPGAPHAANKQLVTQDTEAALLYTSGTTGLPKGCVLTNSYFLNCGEWYMTQGGYCAVYDTGERMITPLPLFHMNALACSAMVSMAIGGCVSYLDRFHPTSWWDSVKESKASIIHYLGVMPAMLIGAPSSPADRDHTVRFGFGAGVDGTLHAPFEERFGFPLVEAWAMNETGGGGAMIASGDPRHVGTHCFGTVGEKMEVRLIADDGQDVEEGTQGELLVRSKGPDPRFGFFDRYLKNPDATNQAWEDGWFHTGDIVRQNTDGTFVFIDRKKNVIRRSGENIAAVEVENALLSHNDIDTIAVAGTPDPVRGDEVFALVVATNPPVDPTKTAEDILAYSLSRLAYYKAPGYIAFVDALPLTSTNKIKRGDLKALVASLIDNPATQDVRALKRRTK
ncbi:MAG: AMP-binding protein [Kordiimonadaceae bacterium]|nr:AMP-binding protein [Kordiimonadaceae bacterium]